MSNIHNISLRLLHGHSLCISFSDMGKAQLACLSSPFGVKIRGGKLHLSILHAKWNKISVCSICFGKLGIFMKFCAYRQAVNEFQLELKLVFSYKFLKASRNRSSLQTNFLSIWQLGWISPRLNEDARVDCHWAHDNSHKRGASIHIFSIYHHDEHIMITSEAVILEEIFIHSISARPRSSHSKI